MLPQLVDRSAGHPAGLMLVPAAVHTATALVSNVGYGVAAGT